MLPKIIDGRTDLVIDFLKEGNEAVATDQNGTPVIKWCAYYGDVTAVKHLLSEGESLSSLGVNFNLHEASFHGHWKLVQFLVESGADVNYKDSINGETPLHAAICKAGRPAYNLIVEILLSNGADPNAPTIPGRETGGFMRDVRTRGETPLHRAAAFGDEAMIEMLLKAGAEKSSEDERGETPLSWASWHLRPGSILELLTYGSHTIHPERVHAMKSDHGEGWGNGIEINLLGNPHT